MANIDKELKAIMDAVYGEEVRGSIHDALKAGNDEINRYGLQESARVAAEQARAQAESARATAENARAGAESSREAAELLRQQGETSRQQATQAAVTAAENAATAANTAADRANAVADEDISDKQVQFTEAAEKSEIESGDTLGTICGKVKKSLAEIKEEFVKVNGNIQKNANILDIGSKVFGITTIGYYMDKTHARFLIPMIALYDITNVSLVGSPSVYTLATMPISVVALETIRATNGMLFIQVETVERTAGEMCTGSFKIQFQTSETGAELTA